MRRVPAPRCYPFAPACRTFAPACCTLAFACCTLAFAGPALSQTPAPHPASRPALRPRPPSEPVSPPSTLPITRVALYKNGVGFFEHAGRVQGDQAVTIDFTSAQLNDVLQSLTAIDLGGGRISGAGYNSATPLDQQLKTLPLALSDNPSDVDFYQAIRGARVQVNAPGGSFTGRILSIDLRASSRLPSEGRGSDSASPAVYGTGDRRFLTIVADSGGVRTLELTPAATVTLLDTALHTDVTRYLELIAANRSEGLRHLTLTDRGTGARELRVSYISEVPVWKSTYRILFTDGGSKPGQDATLQGWSVVDNTTGSDWTNVHLDLIAGAPQSFIQPLSTPYYARRPEIPIAEEAQLTPQTHESGDVVSTNETVTVESAAASPALDLKARGRSIGGVMGGVAHGNGLGLGSGGNIGGGLRHIGGAEYNQLAQASFNANSTTKAYDDFFEYTLTDPITIRKNESALVPILQTKLPVERVTLWSVQQPVALRALWLTNSSTLTLDRGSFSIVENGSFGGEGLLDPIHPGEKRLLSYAADQAVHVSTDHTNNSRRVTQLKIAAGVLTETSTDIQEVEYAIRNAAPDPRLVLIEQPILQGWTLESDPKPAETTSTVYRFRVATKPSETVHLHIGQRHTNYESIRLVDRTEDQLRLLLTNAKVPPAALAALQPVFEAHARVVQLDAEMQTRQNEVNEISADQTRLRQNLQALKGTPEEKALATRYTGELNTQEDRLAELRKELADLHTQRNAADVDFNTRLEAVQFDETL